jgi:hypothetical protein
VLKGNKFDEQVPLKMEIRVDGGCKMRKHKNDEVEMASQARSLGG